MSDYTNERIKGLALLALHDGLPPNVHTMFIPYEGQFNVHESQGFVAIFNQQEQQWEQIDMQLYDIDGSYYVAGYSPAMQLIIISKP